MSWWEVEVGEDLETINPLYSGLSNQEINSKRIINYAIDGKITQQFLVPLCLLRISNKIRK